MADKGRGGGALGKGNPGGEREEREKQTRDQQSFGSDPIRGNPSE